MLNLVGWRKPAKRFARSWNSRRMRLWRSSLRDRSATTSYPPCLSRVGARPAFPKTNLGTKLFPNFSDGESGPERPLAGTLTSLADHGVGQRWRRQWLPVGSSVGGPNIAS